MTDMTERDAMPRRVADAVRLLRDDATFAPDREWRDRVLTASMGGESAHDAARPQGAVGPERSARGWTVRPLHAVAAGLLCALVGAGTTALVLRQSDGVAPPGVASNASEASLVRFVYDAPGATSVQLVGDFNGWTPGAVPLRRSADGRTWLVEVPLPPGRYAYSFLVDGTLAPDPRAPSAPDDDFGSPNSVLLVTGS